MKISKKLLIIALTAVAAMSVFTACTDKPEENKQIADWHADMKQHWQINEAGEKVELGAHELDTAKFCNICYHTAYDFSDGSYTLAKHNAHKDVVHAEYYTNNGDLEKTMDFEYEYDDEGNMTSEKSYENGALIFESKKAINKDGFGYNEYEIYYLGDGSKTLYEYDTNYSLTAEKVYLADGSLKTETKFEYEYSDENEIIGLKEYVDGRLVTVEEYEDVAGDPPYLTKQIKYNEDGSYTVTNVDKMGNTTGVTEYNADGSEK